MQNAKINATVWMIYFILEYVLYSKINQQ